MQEMPQPPVEASTPAADAPPATEPAAPSPQPEVDGATIDAAECAPPPVVAPADLPPAVCAAKLAELFPALFGAGRALPIKLRVQADIQQRAPGVFSRKSLSIFLHRHTTSTPYIRALVNSPHRFDLDGQPAGEVTEEHRLAATAELERRRAIVEARRAAERQAQRDAHRDAQRQARAAAPAAVAARGDAVAGATAPADGPATDATPAQRPPRPPHGRRVDNRPRGRPGDGPHGRPQEGPGNRPPAIDRSGPPTQASPQRPPQGRSDAGLAVPAAPFTPEQAAENEARRGRAALLRLYETTTLTRANFCALKGLSETALEAALAQARTEREQRPREARPDARDDAPTDRARPAYRGGGEARDGSQGHRHGGPTRPQGAKAPLKPQP